MRKTTLGKVSFPQNEEICHEKKSAFRMVRKCAANKGDFPQNEKTSREQK